MGQELSSPDKEVSLQQIQEFYRKFANECPSGNLHLHEFKRFFGVNSKSTEEESAFMENLFRSFDTNKDGSVDFMEYVAGLHLVLRGKLEDKLRWSFKVYDRNGNGCLDRQEVTHIVTNAVWTSQTLLRSAVEEGLAMRDYPPRHASVLSPFWIINKIKRHNDPDAGDIEDVCDRLFDLVDKNKDNQISLEEFIEGAERDPWVMEQLKLDIVPCDWFTEQQEKKT